MHHAKGQRRTIGRRLAQAAAIAAASAMALTACGGGGEADSGDDGKVELRFSWWGADARHQSTLEIIDAFEAENPGIEIKPEYGDWGGYWDKLATQVASGDAPDIIQMDDKYLREYGDRGALLDLEGVDVSQFDEGTIENGTTDDGLLGITTGINAMVLMTNPEIFEEAGVELPDDETWTWDDYAEITKEITENTDGKYGATGPNEPAGLQIWARQAGKHLIGDDGALGVDESDIEEYFQHHLDLVENGSYPGASIIAEDQSPGPDQSLTGTGVAAMGMWWTNQLTALSGSAGVDLVPLRMPSHTGDSSDSGLWYKSSMLMSGYSQSDHPEEVKAFIDFFVNSQEAGELNLTDRGLPSNGDVRESVVAQLEGQDAVSADFIADIEDELGAAEPIPAMGFSELQDIIYRYELEVFFGRQSPADAAKAARSEMENAIG
ncbi:ABC transporter substrate-binding protein [Zhihengliuella halotolerans]|uniref:Carbohydrate ABC transporter substrate-binding protein (CUT1 family) n=1 Tax=Zhihengliuella halotolerans TaxID=370736 RepID=A0A4V2GA14_9MICC|nr:ABC transporter substrate-binding protein [Zhihengliuella halotolerans]RZU62516.1 carbohydrate ABC transporter substrate-binding protein (CUT1 family) [Zhihengliuella halotolerans]